jgi:hypothetical protein
VEAKVGGTTRRPEASRRITNMVQGGGQVSAQALIGCVRASAPSRRGGSWPCHASQPILARIAAMTRKKTPDLNRSQ